MKARFARVNLAFGNRSSDSSKTSTRSRVPEAHSELMYLYVIQPFWSPDGLGSAQSAALIAAFEKPTGFSSAYIRMAFSKRSLPSANKAAGVFSTPTGVGSSMRETQLTSNDSIVIITNPNPWPSQGVTGTRGVILYMMEPKGAMFVWTSTPFNGTNIIFSSYGGSTRAIFNCHQHPTVDGTTNAPTLNQSRGVCCSGL